MDEVLQYAYQICEAAMQKVGEDGGAMLNRVVGANVALAHFNNNVYSHKALPAESWRMFYPAYYGEIKRIKEEDEAGRAQRQEAATLAQRVNTLEEKLTLLVGQMEKFFEAQQPVKEDEPDAQPEPEPAPVKRGKAKKTAEPEPEVPAADPDAEEDSDESEADEA